MQGALGESKNTSGDSCLRAVSVTLLGFLLEFHRGNPIKARVAEKTQFDESLIVFTQPTIQPPMNSKNPMLNMALLEQGTTSSIEAVK